MKCEDLVIGGLVKYKPLLNNRRSYARMRRPYWMQPLPAIILDIQRPGKEGTTYVTVEYDAAWHRNLDTRIQLVNMVTAETTANQLTLWTTEDAKRANTASKERRSIQKSIEFTRISTERKMNKINRAIRQEGFRTRVVSKLGADEKVFVTVEADFVLQLIDKSSES